MTSLASQLSESCRHIIANCKLLFDYTINGTDQKVFVSTCARVTEDLQHLLKLCTSAPDKPEKEELTKKAAAIKAVIVKLIQQLRQINRDTGGQPASDPQIIVPLKNEFTLEIREVIQCAQKFTSDPPADVVKSTTPARVSTFKASNSPSTPTRTSGYSASEEPAQETTISPPTPAPAPAPTPIRTPDDVPAMAVICLDMLTVMLTSMDQRDRVKFNEATIKTNESVQKLVNIVPPSKLDSNSDPVFQLRQNLVSLISHSKMFFVNNDDEYLKQSFSTFKDKVERALLLYIPENFPCNFQHYVLQKEKLTALRKTNSTTQVVRTTPSEPIDIDKFVESTPPPAQRGPSRFEQKYSSLNLDFQKKTSPRVAPRTSKYDSYESNQSYSYDTDESQNDTLYNGSAGSSYNDDFPNISDEEKYIPNSGDDLAPAPSTFSINPDPIDDDSNINKALDSDLDFGSETFSGYDNSSLSSSTNSLKGFSESASNEYDSYTNSNDPRVSPRTRSSEGWKKVRGLPSATSEPEVQQVPRLRMTDRSGSKFDLKSSKAGDDAPLAPRMSARRNIRSISAGSLDVKGLQAALKRVDEEGRKDEEEDQKPFTNNEEGEGEGDGDDGDDEDGEGSISKEIIQIIKDTVDISDESKLAQLQEKIDKRLEQYKAYIMQQALDKRKSPRSGNNVVQSRQKKVEVKIPFGIKRTETMATFSSGGKRTDDVPFQIVQLKPTTPRSRLAKTLSEITCQCIAEIYNYAKHFSDLGVSFKADQKFEPRDESKDTNTKKKLLTVLKNLLVPIKECMDMGLSPNINNSAFEKVRARLQELSKNCEKNGEIVKVETKLFKKGQYIRFMKQALLLDILYRSDTLFYSGSQLCSVLIAFTPDDVSCCYHVLAMCSTYFNLYIDLVNDIETFSYLLVEENLMKSQAQKLKCKPFKATKSADSIWKEPPEPESLDKNDLFRAGTLNNLVIRLTGSVFNNDLMGAFLAGYELFSSPTEVWTKLEERYHVPKDSPEAERAQFLKMRVSNIVLQWLKTDFHSIDLQVLANIENFAEKTIKKDFVEMASFMLNELTTENRFAAVPPTEKIEPPTEVPVCTFVTYHPYEIFLMADSQTIAEQITLIETIIFQRIGKIELTDQKWSKEKYHILSRNVIALIQRVNKLSFFVATTLLLQKKQKDRTKLLRKIISIAKCLVDMNNFNSVMGILAGLGLSPTNRLKYTFLKLPQKEQELYNQINMHQDPSNSFKFLREQLRGAKNSVMPYLGTYLSDLTFMDDGNPDYIEVDNVKLINLPKHNLIMRTIKQIQNYQNLKYDIQHKEPLYTFLYQMPVLEEKELYEMSLEREPRGAQPKDIE
eukprot:TRINITY_DN6066_c0_g1_i1.p1 TRINITY_DN6066_c0_g1~~TRINITY_DN6066_c0_g1_i1.p1  ORF type:complete len:1343 (-),score=351.14 TRINITY_DN6066_c0_g1_i1:708-4736(-)